ncbi:MAG: hypothetical protein J1E38_03295, partial [Paramuribaculum sp.]|nr:hypothetical protein [Paramuribaculum sp.]
ASVHPEPGSNSPLFIFFFSFRWLAPPCRVESVPLRLSYRLLNAGRILTETLSMLIRLQLHIRGPDGTQIINAIPQHRPFSCTTSSDANISMYSFSQLSSVRQSSSLSFPKPLVPIPIFQSRNVLQSYYKNPPLPNFSD